VGTRRARRNLRSLLPGEGHFGPGHGCGEDKIIYGSEAPLFHPQWALRAFMDFQIPEDLCAGYGYPQLTDQAKRKILGENLLRLHGLDVGDMKARLSAKP
jgi:hypothetical protein